MNGISKAFYIILPNRAKLPMSAMRAAPTQSSPPVFATFKIITHVSK